MRAWEAKLTPALAEGLRRRPRGKAGRTCYGDETYLKVDARWCYVYHAIDSTGVLVDVLFSERCDTRAAMAIIAGTSADITALSAPVDAVWRHAMDPDWRTD